MTPIILYNSLLTDAIFVKTTAMTTDNVIANSGDTVISNAGDLVVIDNISLIDDVTTSGYDIRNILDYRTYTFWQSASSGTKYITLDCGSAKTADCLAIIGHNLQTANATVSVESSTNNIDWIERSGKFTPSSDKAFIRLLVSTAARYWRIKIVTAAIAPKLAVVMLGKKLTFPYPPDAPYIPYSESIEAETSRSNQGHLLGSVIRFKRLTINVKFSNLSRTWCLNDFKTFWDSHASNLKPFFYAWDVDNYPEHVYYVVVDEKAAMEMPMSILSVVDNITLKMVGVKE